MGNVSARHFSYQHHHPATWGRIPELSGRCTRPSLSLTSTILADLVVTVKLYAAGDTKFRVFEGYDHVRVVLHYV
jgi:hypothetical protein